MTETYVLTLSQNAILLALLLAGPILLLSLVVGSLVSLVQAATQMNEATLSFVPKALATLAVLLLLGGWMLQQALTFTHNLFTNLPNLVLH
jgi:flagellar biosynthetic protein FliQ